MSNFYYCGVLGNETTRFCDANTFQSEMLIITFSYKCADSIRGLLNQMGFSSVLEKNCVLFLRQPYPGVRSASSKQDHGDIQYF